MGKQNKLLSTGIKGLDSILEGGLIPERFYLVRGGPGTGKTTLGLHFLNKGCQENENTLMASMTEPISKIKENAKNFGFNTEDINFIDLSPKADFIEKNKDYDIFPSSQMDQKPLIEEFTSAVEQIKPRRIFLDGMAQLKYLASNNFNFRKQVLSLMQFLMNYESTVLLTSEIGNNSSDDDLQFLVDGIINLIYSSQTHYLEIKKYRGSDYKKGLHSLKFKEKGIEVYPKLSPADINYEYPNAYLSSGIKEIDRLLKGGLKMGTTTTLTGPSGVGKTTLGTQFIKTGADKGHRSIIYTFEEDESTILNRSKSINIPLADIKNSDKLTICKINPLEYTPEEFSNKVKQDIEKKQISIVMIDSITGYFLSFKTSHKTQVMMQSLHALAEYLKQHNVTVFMINEMRNITGDFRATDQGISFLADNIIFLRYLEIKGRLNKAIGVLKKRMSDFENTMREFSITGEGLEVGAPLENLRGILRGTPEMISEIQEDK